MGFFYVGPAGLFYAKVRLFKETMSGWKYRDGRLMSNLTSGESFWELGMAEKVEKMA